jgi:hypothetical protein
VVCLESPPSQGLPNFGSTASNPKPLSA